MPGFEWVVRHTWQSWRERYKKHYNRLDKHIAAIVSVNQVNEPPQPESQYGLFKLTNSENSNPRRRQRVTNENKKTDERTEAGPIASASGAVQNTQDSDWAIRVGNDPTPDWAGQASANGTIAERMNQPDANTATLRTFVLTPANQSGPRATPTFGASPEFAQDFGIQNPLIEQEIQTIATELQFFTNEIRAYYDRTQDLAATRQRFERLRDLINSTP